MRKMWGAQMRKIRGAQMSARPQPTMSFLSLKNHPLSMPMSSCGTYNKIKSCIPIVEVQAAQIWRYKRPKSGGTSDPPPTTEPACSEKLVCPRQADLQPVCNNLQQPSCSAMESCPTPPVVSRYSALQVREYSSVLNSVIQSFLLAAKLYAV